MAILEAASKLIIWDFDGTLAYRSGLWSGCLLEILDSEEPGHSVLREDLIPYLQSGFPWHAPDRAHPELGEAIAWWECIEQILRRAYLGVGYPHERAMQLAQLAHVRYLDISTWSLFDDSLPVLAQLHKSGWRHMILSNHVPELASIVEGLGLAGLIDRVVTSAMTGYEKPHPEAYVAALQGVGEGARVWMVGDNPDADIRGAEAAGIPAILVRSQADQAIARSATDLWGVIAFVDGEEQSSGRPATEIEAEP